MIVLAIVAASLQAQSFTSGGLRQGMTRAEVAAATGQAVPDSGDVAVQSDGRTYIAGFCAGKLAALSAPYRDVEWLAAIEWLHSQGFRLGQARVTAWEDGKQEVRELRQPLVSAQAPFRVVARMLSRSSPEGGRVLYQLDFRATGGCSMPR